MKTLFTTFLLVLAVALVIEQVYVFGFYGQKKEEAGKFYILDVIVQSVKDGGTITVQTNEGDIILMKKQ